MTRSIIVAFLSRFTGRFVGRDSAGNLFYVGKKTTNAREKRWVVFAKECDSSAISAPCHSWLHHMRDDFPHDDDSLCTPNMTGTAQAYLPDGHILNATTRAPATGDYQPWQPN